MNTKQMESELALLRLILTTLATAKQISSNLGATSSYLGNYLADAIDQTAVQISLLQEVMNKVGQPLDRDVN